MNREFLKKKTLWERLLQDGFAVLNHWEELPESIKDFDRKGGESLYNRYDYFDTIRKVFSELRESEKVDSKFSVLREYAEKTNSELRAAGIYEFSETRVLLDRDVVQKEIVDFLLKEGEGCSGPGKNLRGSRKTGKKFTMIEYLLKKIIYDFNFSMKIINHFLDDENIGGHFSQEIRIFY